MKTKFLISAGAASILALTLATASIAGAGDLRTLPDAPLALKCAVYKGDLGIRAHTAAEVAGRECESYWADDTDEDAREMAKLMHVAASASAASSTLR